jgi:hypothetical protein
MIVVFVYFDVEPTPTPKPPPEWVLNTSDAWSDYWVKTSKLMNTSHDKKSICIF